MSETPFTAEGSAALPRSNGELVFNAPWESRVFGVAAALRERGLFDWDEFRECLCEEIAAWEADHAADDVWSYYARFQTALERLIARKGACSEAELEAREHALAARPDGHDHGHPHEHDV
jgi:nitrile hydratase accessory protein